MPTDSTNEEVENTPTTPIVGMCEPPGAVSRFTYDGAKRLIESVQEVCSDVVEEFERDTKDKTGAEEVDFSHSVSAREATTPGKLTQEVDHEPIPRQMIFWKRPTRLRPCRTR